MSKWYLEDLPVTDDHAVDASQSQAENPAPNLRQAGQALVGRRGLQLVEVANDREAGGARRQLILGRPPLGGEEDE